MFTDPQEVTISGSTVSLPRVRNGELSSDYANVDATVALSLKQERSGKGRLRSPIRFSKTKVAADPLTSVNSEIGLAITMVIDRPRSGFTLAEVQALVTAFKTWLTDAHVAQLVGGET